MVGEIAGWFAAIYRIPLSNCSYSAFIRTFCLRYCVVPSSLKTSILVNPFSHASTVVLFLPLLRQAVSPICYASSPQGWRAVPPLFPTIVVLVVSVFKRCREVSLAGIHVPTVLQTAILRSRLRRPYTDCGWTSLTTHTFGFATIS